MAICDDADAVIDHMAAQRFSYLDKSDAFERLERTETFTGDVKDLAAHQDKQAEKAAANRNFVPSQAFIDVEEGRDRKHVLPLMELIMAACNRVNELPKYKDESVHAIEITYRPCNSWFEDGKDDPNARVILADGMRQDEFFDDLKKSHAVLVDNIYTRRWKKITDDTGKIYYERPVEAGASSKYDSSLEYLLEKMAKAEGLSEEQVKPTWSLNKEEKGWVLRLEEPVAKILLEKGLGKLLSESEKR